MRDSKIIIMWEAQVLICCLVFPLETVPLQCGRFFVPGLWTPLSFLRSNKMRVISKGMQNSSCSEEDMITECSVAGIGGAHSAADSVTIRQVPLGFSCCC